MSAAVCARILPSPPAPPQPQVNSNTNQAISFTLTPSQTEIKTTNMISQPPELQVIPPYYASGSLPRINNGTTNANSRRLGPRNTMSLTRANSMRNSWANNRAILNQQPAMNHQITSSSTAPDDVVSVNSRFLIGQSKITTNEGRNKYRTLTSAETKQLTKYLNSRQPARTASVLNKPRAPPMVVTDLDDYGMLSIAPPRPPRSLISEITSDTNDGLPVDSTTTRRQTIRCGSSCSNGCNRNSLNLSTNNSNSLHSNQNTPIVNQNKFQVSPNDSVSNLSFRSSLDIVDSAYGSDRLQTMSVDLGNQSRRQYSNNIMGYNHAQYYDHQDKNKLSDDSYSSAKSHISDTSKLKNTLSSSTSKVFQNQIFNIKRFFRHMPMRRSFMGGNNNSSNENTERKTNADTNRLEDQYSLNGSLSHISLNRSQSPPVCPPPPKELKSMSYMEDKVNYSNYDEFTRARNKQTLTLLNSYARASQRQSSQNDDCGLPIVDRGDSESWQLASLPISFERNLTTVFEEKQNPTAKTFQKTEAPTIAYQNTTPKTDEHARTIKPPNNFEDSVGVKNTASSTCSSQSLASIMTTDSVLDFHRQNNSAFRFSYAESNNVYAQVTKNNSGLPPRMPNGENKPTNSLGNSSNNSSILNGINVYDRDAGTNMNNSDLNSNCFDNDNDTTILSDTSTLNGEANNIVYINKCAELERTIESLKNRLLTKEKELTDLQLKQWSSDYHTEQLKSTISKLEKENAQLKAVMAKYDRVAPAAVLALIDERVRISESEVLPSQRMGSSARSSSAPNWIQLFRRTESDTFHL